MVLKKIKAGSIYSSTCLTEGCSRKGLWALSIADHPVVSQLPMTRGETEVLCGACAPKWKALWKAMNGEQHERDTIKHLKTLKEAFDNPKNRELRTSRVDAVDALRVSGFSAEEVGYARAMVEQGSDPRDVFEQMLYGEPAADLRVVA